jgi:hypothetical protein
MSKNIHNISKENNYETKKPKEIIPIYLSLFNIFYYLILTSTPSNKTHIEAQISFIQINK